jgi:hypothetical protein
MEKYLFMRPVLVLLAQDRFVCRAVSILLRVAAVLLALLSLTTFFMAGKLIFDLPADGILGGVFFELFLVVGVYAASHALFIRAEQIEEVPQGPYVVLRIAPLLLRGIGEAYAALVAFVAIGGGIYVWFTNLALTKVLSPAMRELLPNVGSDASFAGGIGFMVSGVAAAVGTLLVAYLLAEVTTLVVRSTKAADTATRPNLEERFRSRVS